MQQAVTVCLERKVEAMIRRSAARQAPDGGADSNAAAARTLPLIRLRVDYTGFRCISCAVHQHASHK